MSSSASPLPIAQPWTPPETDIDSSPRPDYFSDPFKPASNFSEEDLDNRWPLSPSTPELIRRMSKPREVSGDPPKSRPKPISSATAPYTPTKSVDLHNLNSSGALQYPYTPDSSRILRANTQPVTPLAPSPWISDTSSPRSPVQSALSSCMIHMENLIQTRQPNDDQMEFIVAQFETMASYLSAPESQTKKTDDHLFSEPEPTSTNDVANGSANGLGITTTNSNEINSNLVSNGDKPVTEVTDLSEEYVREVGKYIAGVQKSAEDLKMRLDEVKQLNGIQVDIINDLRRELRHVYEQLEKQRQNSIELNTSPAEQNGNSAEVDNEEDQVKIDDVSETKAPRRRRRIIIVRKKQQSGFWASIGNAVDAMSDMLLDW